MEFGQEQPVVKEDEDEIERVETNSMKSGATSMRRVDDADSDNMTEMQREGEFSDGNTTEFIRGGEFSQMDGSRASVVRIEEDSSMN
jgi:hypothetical protein